VIKESIEEGPDDEVKGREKRKTSYAYSCEIVRIFLTIA
jgi:hypothetical protein